MKTDGTMEWFDLMHEYFGVYMTEGRANMWLTELRQSTQSGGTGPGTTDDELCRAIRFYRSKTKNAADADNKRKKEATLDDLIMWVRWMRKEDRQSRENPNADGVCGICKDGWVTAYRTMSENPSLDDFMGNASEPCAVPCTCDRGRHWMMTCKDYAGITEDHRQVLVRLAQLGARQESRRRELAAQLQDTPR